ncbi:PREDICTED: uncharacterized protein LOC106751579 [Dinoponera quadriceps]|uniref:Gustatory receptor n=1 Tax=Dinoponera quadriceps TaxID=609295 RepID=A0A6P3YDR4_DINQU|nr:PREDICTED: uncharacterized protein LOC106751579 [Dinoponera quadriceps]
MKLFAAPKYLSDAVAPLVTLNYLLGLRIFEYPRGKLHTVPSLIYLLFLFGILCVSIHVNYKLVKKSDLLKLQHALHASLMCAYASVVTNEMILGYIYTKIFIINTNFIVLSEFSIFVRYLQTRFKLINELLYKYAAVSTTKGIKLDLFATEDYTKITDSQQRQDIPSIKIFHLNRQLQTRIRISVSEKCNFVRSRTRCRLTPQLQKQFQMELQGQSRNQFRDSNLNQKLVIIMECRRRTHLVQTIRILKMLSTSFGIQVISEIGVAIIMITLLLYNLYILVQQQQRATGYGQLKKALVAIMFATINIFKIVYINRICKQTTNEGKKTSEIIHEIYRCCPDIDIREEIHQFGLQILWSPVEFSTFGISLNYHVLSSCLNTVTTYLVIMIQIDNSLESSKNS